MALKIVGTGLGRTLSTLSAMQDPHWCRLARPHLVQTQSARSWPPQLLTERLPAGK
jgi:hypothetical protein